MFRGLSAPGPKRRRSDAPNTIENGRKRTPDAVFRARRPTRPSRSRRWTTRSRARSTRRPRRASARRATSRTRARRRAGTLPGGPDVAMYSKRTAPAFQRCKNQQKRCSRGRDRVDARRRRDQRARGEDQAHQRKGRGIGGRRPRRLRGHPRARRRQEEPAKDHHRAQAHAHARGPRGIEPVFSRMAFERTTPAKSIELRSSSYQDPAVARIVL